MAGHTLRNMLLSNTVFVTCYVTCSFCVFPIHYVSCYVTCYVTSVYLPIYCCIIAALFIPSKNGYHERRRIYLKLCRHSTNLITSAIMQRKRRRRNRFVRGLRARDILLNRKNEGTYHGATLSVRGPVSRKAH